MLELVSRLDRPTPDRSRRDFAIVCDLLRLGLAKEDIWDLVSGRSKFESNGRSYFDVTISNAERRIHPRRNGSVELGSSQLSGSGLYWGRMVVCTPSASTSLRGHVSPAK